ncbi:MAG: adenosine kinase [Proteobacteria bacterium]|nr:adenosine kinase [Pseudomonadota bacterium]
MAESLLDVAGIGNAVVDVIAREQDKFLDDNGLTKGTMTLIDLAEAEALYAKMGPAIECSGGSAANTLAGLASLGGTAAFVGKVRDDDLGGIFRHDIRAVGVEYDTPAATDGPPTARCLVLVTPDAQRTMQTYLGACAELSPGDIDPKLIKRAKVTYLEGYLWDPPEAKKAFKKAAGIAHEAGNKVALNLSDPLCVDRHRTEFRELIGNHVDILFANETEIVSLCEVGDFNAALQEIRGLCDVAVLTRSDKGSVVITDSDIHILDAEAVDKVVDTTGAGDLYAAGFLFGLTRGCDIPTCGRLGGKAAAAIIGQFGARSEKPLADLLDF